MGALNFKAQFADDVVAGKKRQTIRARRKDGRDPKPGDILFLYTGMRTKACRKLGEAVCKSVEPVRIERAAPGAPPYPIVGDNEEWWPGDKRNPSATELYFAQRDGFKNWEEMWRWFESVHGLPFEGLLIRWDRLI